ncbi:hypothetical protein [Natronomonas amylolytica]|uniref:hypothetical protein n=1 Tax=Natronomonas amylolytica TaxID=3108498 RepID=UPI00300AD12C
MLQTVAYYDPVDYHMLKHLVKERIDGVYDAERHRTALTNLKELNMVKQPGMAHEYIHITEQGWSHLGGKTPRHGVDVEAQNAVVCPVCATDEMVASGE